MSWETSGSSEPPCLWPSWLPRLLCGEDVPPAWEGLGWSRHCLQISGAWGSAQAWSLWGLGQWPILGSSLCWAEGPGWPEIHEGAVLPSCCQGLSGLLVLGRPCPCHSFALLAISASLCRAKISLTPPGPCCQLCLPGGSSLDLPDSCPRQDICLACRRPYWTRPRQSSVAQPPLPLSGDPV